jgi:hypothetical protein
MELSAKLQIKPGTTVAVLRGPDGVELGLPDATPDAAASDAVIVFVTASRDLELPEVALAVASAREDRLTWVCYPKAGQLGTDLNRDSLAAAMVSRGTRPVRQVSIDATWSALRFRPAA